LGPCRRFSGRCRRQGTAAGRTSSAGGGLLQTEAAGQGKEKETSRVFQGAAVFAFFISPKGKGRRRIQAGGIGRLRLAVATGGCWDTIWPRRAARAGCFGSPPVGFRAASPGGVEKEAVGLFWLAG
jgi:hypothetical protein